MSGGSSGEYNNRRNINRFSRDREDRSNIDKYYYRSQGGGFNNNSEFFGNINNRISSLRSRSCTNRCSYRGGTGGRW